ncbi:hypothetical protein ABEB36_015519 [Hypothenemus hampei]|uniref:Nuclease HARBI1 n=1 Tax=Hypothenemus hampei TaxID=57062 RepID=A0ABD1DZP6_HYPHA
MNQLKKISDHFDSSDDDLVELNEMFKVPKTENYVEMVPLFNNLQYKEHFRISRRVTEELTKRYEMSEYYHHQEGNSPKISGLKQVTIFLWFAVSSFSIVADRFNISKSFLFKIIHRVTDFMSNLSIDFIKWPNQQEILESENYFRGREFPGALL